MRSIVERPSKTGTALAVNIATPPAGAVRVAGQAYDVAGKMYVKDAGAAVPAGRIMLSGLAYTQDGALYVTDSAPAASAIRIHGMAIRNDGALHVNSAGPAVTTFAGLSVVNGRVSEVGL